MNKFLLALMVVGLTPFLLGSAYGGSLSIGVSENSQFLGSTGTDVITDNPCDGTDDDGSDPGDCTAYNFGTEQNPIIISYDPTEGAWHKHMQDPDGDCQSPFCTITEWIKVSGTPWIDWHEILFEPSGMSWIDVTITINPGPGEIVLTDNDPQVMISDSGFGEAVWVTFDAPLPEGTILKIEKVWELSGPTPTPFNDDGSPCPPPDGTTADCDHPFGEVTVLQFPSIPEVEPEPEPEPTVVGGEFLPIETTSLLLAAASSPASWLTTLTIAALGIGVYVFTRNPNNMRNIKIILRDYLDRF